MSKSGRRLVFAVAAICGCALSAAAQDGQCPIEQQVAVTIQTSPSPSLPGQAVRINAFVAPVVSVPDPTGTIQLFDGTNDLGTYPVTAGQVSTTVTFYSAGARALQASYSGDFNYCTAFASYGQPVDRLTPSVALTTSAPAAPFGAPVTLTAQVTPTPPSGVAAPAGPVQFLEGTTVLGTGSLNGGKASFTLSSVNAGSHAITAVLIGDPNWYSVRSTPSTLQVNPAATTTVIAGTSTSSQVTFTAKVSAAAPSVAVPTGTVQFVDMTSNAVLGTAPLPGPSLSFPAAQIAGHPVAAVYSGSVNFTASTSTGIGLPGMVSATGATSANFAPDEIVGLFGPDLGTSATVIGAAPPLPTTIDGRSVTVTDSKGVARQAGLYLAIVSQINCVIPSETASGPATVTVNGSSAIPLRINIAAVAPGLFDASAQILRVKADGSQTVQTVTASTPIVLGSDSVYLLLYGTGIRNRSSLDGVTATIGGMNIPVAYAGAQVQSPGLDQVNVLLPASLQGAGKVNVILTLDGQGSNGVALLFQ
jgi:uncharacterized protein (TIGR03437 family)